MGVLARTFVCVLIIDRSWDSQLFEEGLVLCHDQDKLKFRQAFPLRVSRHRRYRTRGDQLWKRTWAVWGWRWFVEAIGQLEEGSVDVAFLRLQVGTSMEFDLKEGCCRFVTIKCYRLMRQWNSECMASKLIFCSHQRALFCTRRAKTN